MRTPSVIFRRAAPSAPSSPLLRLPARLGSAYRVPILLHYLERHRLACSLVAGQPPVWALLVPHAEVSPIHLERLFAHTNEREDYNDEHLERARSTRRLVIGELRGFSDFFVPIVACDSVEAILVCGPFRRAPFSVAEIHRRWEATTGRSVAGSDADLAVFTRGALGAVTLEPPVLAAIASLLQTVGTMLAGAGDPPRSFDRFVRRHLTALDASRESMGYLATGLVDPAQVSRMLADAVAARYTALGIRRMFTHVVAAAFEARGGGKKPADELVRGSELVHQARAFTAEIGETICAPLGDGGVFFLTSPPSETDAREDLALLAKKIRDMVRRAFGVEAHIGISRGAPREEDLPRCYDEAVLALHAAMHEPRPVVFYEDGSRKRARRVQGGYRAKVNELNRAVVAGAAGGASIAAHGVSREILWRGGGSPDAVRAYFESLTLDLLERIEQRGVLDARTVRGLETASLELLAEAKAVGALPSAFERIVATLAESVRHPTPATTRARIEAARRYVDENSHLPLRVGDAARQAGLSANYFSTLFRKQCSMPFEGYLIGRRLEKARSLLLSSALPIARVSREAGFSSHVHFCAAFRRKFGTTATGYRQRPPPSRAPAT